jgi:hypothetical protein
LGVAPPVRGGFFCPGPPVAEHWAHRHTHRANQRRRAPLQVRWLQPGRSDAATSSPRSTSPHHPVMVVLAGTLAALLLWSLRATASHCSVLPCAGLLRAPPKLAALSTVSPAEASCPTLSAPAHPFFSSIMHRSQSKSSVAIEAVVATAGHLVARPSPDAVLVSASALTVVAASESLPLIPLYNPRA